MSIRRYAAAMALLLFVVWFVSRMIAWGGCSWYGYQTDRETRYAAFVGCMVKLEQGWIPRAELRVVQ